MFKTEPSLIAALGSEAHVWLARPDDVTDAAHLSDCLALLCRDERERYRRFRFEQDRRLYLVAHALVRRALSCYVDVDPAAWRFVSGAHGRPEIAAPQLPVNLRFNLSHTDGLTACVVTLEVACGIDVERTDRQPRMGAIAARLFAGPEQRDLLGREGEADYHERFFSYWTLREAWCKARGTGLARADRSVWFELGGQDGVRIHGAVAGWHGTVLKPTPAHRLAVVVRGTDAIEKPVVCRFLKP